MANLDLTLPQHLNKEPPASATWWECPRCGDYAWLWRGEEAPECSCAQATEHATEQWQVWLGYRASIWSHRGYRVEGETVYAENRADATRLVRESLMDGAVCVRVDDGDYWYATQEAADRDDDGSRADAVVSRVEE